MADRKRISLNGTWNCIADQYEHGERVYFYRPVRKDRTVPGRDPVDHDFEDVDKIKTPSCWNMAREQWHYLERSMWYYRQIKKPPVARGQRAFLCFEGSYYRTRAWINGEPLSGPANTIPDAPDTAAPDKGQRKTRIGHLGGFTPFEWEITDLLSPKMELAILVDAARDADRVPTTVTDWFTYGGLYRDVFIEVRPARFITDVFVRLTGDGRIVAQVSATDPGPARVRIDGLGIDQTVELKATRKSPVPLTGAAGEVSIDAPARLVRWSPQRPKLYKVQVTYGQDAWSDNVGFRTIETRGGEFVLNGEAIRLKGISVHEDHITRGRSLTDADRRDIFREAKALGLNFLRLAHYPHSRRMAQMADREGILLWEEIPCYWRIQWTNPEVFTDASEQLRELIVRDRNRASVILWSVANETPEDAEGRTEFLSRLSQQARQLDPSRLTTAALFKRRADDGTMYCQDELAAHLDVIGINQYAGWYGSDLKKADEMKRFHNSLYPDKPVIVSEFGGGARAGAKGNEKFSEAYLAKLYERQLAGISKSTGVRGTTPWILMDFRAPLRLNKYQRGFNRKGLVDADRKTRKQAFKVYQKFSLDKLK